MQSSDAGRAATRALHRVRWALHVYLVETKLHALRYAVKASFDPNQPRVPAGNPDGGQWTDGGGGGGGAVSGSAGSDTLAGGGGRDIQSHLDIPEERPASTPLRNAVFKLVAREVLDIILVRAQLRGLVGAELRAAVYRALVGLEVASWVVEEGLASIVSYSDPPKTLEELRDAVSHPRAGYEIHHIVEQNSEQLGENARINSRENLVRIPIFKHHQITGFFERENRAYGKKSLREGLKDQDWETRYQEGIDALIQFGVLKP
ncbi:MAG: hypothetical protein ACRECX_14845 [Methyloceanibacter sp.]|uniref:hypothetical protein n=1 Tax=Methyloceanibacter sp. TaxID=1965321 RepID=UPI003D6CF3D4